MTKGNVSPIELARHLKGIDFPANKQDLIQQARDNNADESVLEEMESMPDQEFRSMRDVAKAMRQGDEGDEGEPSHKGHRSHGGHERGGGER